jgi:hypothetical protein
LSWPMLASVSLQAAPRDPRDAMASSSATPSPLLSARQGSHHALPPCLSAKPAATMLVASRNCGGRHHGKRLAWPGRSTRRSTVRPIARELGGLETRCIAMQSSRTLAHWYPLSEDAAPALSIREKRVSSTPTSNDTFHCFVVQVCANLAGLLTRTRKRAMYVIGHFASLPPGTAPRYHMTASSAILIAAVRAARLSRRGHSSPSSMKPVIFF